MNAYGISEESRDDSLEKGQLKSSPVAEVFSDEQPGAMGGSEATTFTEAGYNRDDDVDILLDNEYDITDRNLSEGQQAGAAGGMGGQQSEQPVEDDIASDEVWNIQQRRLAEKREWV